jgi:hypothetical protein
MDSGRSFAAYGNTDSFHKTLPAYECLTMFADFFIMNYIGKIVLNRVI